MMKLIVTVSLLLTLQGCIKVADDDADTENNNQTQGVVFKDKESIFGATKSGTEKDENGRQSLYSHKLIGSIDQDAIVYDADNTLIGICVGRTNSTFDSKGYLVGECDLINE